MLDGVVTNLLGSMKQLWGAVVMRHFVALVAVLSAAGLLGAGNVQAQDVGQLASGVVTHKLPTVDGLPPPTDAKTAEAVLKMARDGYQHIRQDIRDYSCILVKRERVLWRLGNYQYMSAKVRHQRTQADGTSIPFSVYLRFLGPADVKGREVLYVQGENEGKLVARKGGSRFSYITTTLDPLSELAMKDNRYPVTEFGFENLVKRFIEGTEEGGLLTDCTIQLFRGAKVDNRPCTCIEVTKNRSPDTQPGFYVARVYIDEAYQVPIHYEAFDWPAEEGGEPKLLEQYTYRNLKLNVGFSDEDFIRDNPAYQFTPSPTE
jgi:hypothetical protein